MQRLSPAALAALAFSLTCSAAPAADWPGWRGPNRDGVVADFVAPREWPGKLAEVWATPVGEGHSSPVVVDGRLYQFSREKDDEVLRCLEADGGKEVWRIAYAAPYKMHPAATGHGKGPKATPAVQDGRIYTLGVGGVLACWDVRNGKEVWKKDFSARFKLTSPLYGAAASPLLIDGLCVAQVGGNDKGALSAFDARTGEEKWSWDGDGPGYSSPIVAELGGVRQIVAQTQQYVVGVAPADGKLLWKMPFKTAYDQNSITLLPYKDGLISSGYDRPLTRLRLEKKGDGFEASAVWSRKEHSLYLSSPVRKGDRLFGFTHRGFGRLFCVEADSGKTLWQSDARLGDNAALLLAGDYALALLDSGRLLVLRTDADAYETVAEYAVSDAPTWAHPVVLGDRIFIKDRTTLRCLTWKEPKK
jgi:outer membrane protein assembly factor BamB